MKASEIYTPIEPIYVRTTEPAYRYTSADVESRFPPSVRRHVSPSPYPTQHAPGYGGGVSLPMRMPDIRNSLTQEKFAQVSLDCTIRLLAVEPNSIDLVGDPIARTASAISPRNTRRLSMSQICSPIYWVARHCLLLCSECTRSSTEARHTMKWNAPPGANGAFNNETAFSVVVTTSVAPRIERTAPRSPRATTTITRQRLGSVAVNSSASYGPLVPCLAIDRELTWKNQTGARAVAPAHSGSSVAVGSCQCHVGVSLVRKRKNGAAGTSQ